MAKIDYEYQGRVHPFQFVQQTACQMIEEALETFPQKSILPTEYSADKCSKLLNELTPQTAQYGIKARPEESGVEGERKEKWSGAKYTVRRIDESQLAAWTDIKPLGNSVYPQAKPLYPFKS